jgi:hypothetical protein
MVYVRETFGSRRLPIVVSRIVTVIDSFRLDNVQLGRNHLNLDIITVPFSTSYKSINR